MELSIIVIALLASAYFSANEIAFIVANKIKIEVRAKKNVFGAQVAKSIMKNPEELLTTLLIAIFLESNFNFSSLETLLITTFILLIIGEILPKAITREVADLAVLYFSYPYKLLRIILLPFIRIVQFLLKFLFKLINQEKPLVTLLEKEDLKLLINEGQKVGNVKEDNTEIIKRVIDLGDQKVYAAMRPRTDIVACDVNSPIENSNF
jgi:putative hemolysin